MSETPIYDEVLEDHIDQASTDREFNDLDRMDKETRGGSIR